MILPPPTQMTLVPEHVRVIVLLLACILFPRLAQLLHQWVFLCQRFPACQHNPAGSGRRATARARLYHREVCCAAAAAAGKTPLPSAALQCAYDRASGIGQRLRATDRGGREPVVDALYLPVHDVRGGGCARALLIATPTRPHRCAGVRADCVTLRHRAPVLCRAARWADRWAG